MSVRQNRGGTMIIFFSFFAYFSNTTTKKQEKQWHSEGIKSVDTHILCSLFSLHHPSTKLLKLEYFLEIKYIHIQPIANLGSLMKIKIVEMNNEENKTIELKRWLWVFCFILFLSKELCLYYRCTYDIIYIISHL